MGYKSCRIDLAILIAHIAGFYGEVDVSMIKWPKELEEDNYSFKKMYAKERLKAENM